MNITKSPPAINLTGNPVEFTIQGNKYAVSGTFATFTFIFFTGETINHNDSMTIAWGSVSLNIVFKNTPDNSGLQFIAGTITDVWIASFLTFIERNYYINRDFYRFTTYQWVARTAGTYYDVTYTSAIALTVIACSTPSPTEPVLKENYRIIAQVFSGTTLLGEDAMSADAQSKVIFDAQEYLDTFAEINRSFIFTKYISSKAIQHASFYRTFYLRYAEMYEGRVRKVNQTQTYGFMQGGLSKAKLAELASVSKTVADLLNQSKMFLTWAPPEKLTTPEAHERLYFLKKATEAMTVKIKVYYTDDTTATATWASIGVTADNLLYEIIADYRAITIIPKTIDKYEIWVENAAGVMQSDRRTFIPQYEYHENRLQLLFRNSFGVYDTIEANGVTQYDTDLQRDDFSDGNDYTRTLKVLASNYMQANTGPLTREMYEHLTELYMSREVYLNVFNRWVPVVITDKKKPPFDDSESRFNLDFTLEFSAAENYFSTPAANPAGGTPIPEV